MFYVWQTLPYINKSRKNDSLAGLSANIICIYLEDLCQTFITTEKIVSNHQLTKATKTLPQTHLKGYHTMTIAHNLSILEDFMIIALPPQKQDFVNKIWRFVIIYFQVIWNHTHRSKRRSWGPFWRIHLHPVKLQSNLDYLKFQQLDKMIVQVVLTSGQVYINYKTHTLLVVKKILEKYFWKLLACKGQQISILRQILLLITWHKPHYNKHL